MSDTFLRTDPALVKKRYAAERRFKAYGIAALVTTALFLAFLLVDIVSKGLPAFVEHRVALKVKIDPALADANNPAKGDYDKLLKDAFRAEFPNVTARAERKKLTGLLSTGAADDLRDRIVANPSLIGQEINVPALLSDNADLYLKGHETGVRRTPGAGTLQIAEAGEGFVITGDVANLATGQIVRANGGALRIAGVKSGTAEAEAILKPETLNPALAGQWDIVAFSTPEANRRIDDQEALWLESLKDHGQIEKGLAWRFFTEGDSREAELAGIRGALAGSL
jgi:hypothetical protein